MMPKAIEAVESAFDNNKEELMNADDNKKKSVAVRILDAADAAEVTNHSKVAFSNIFLNRSLLSNQVRLKSRVIRSHLLKAPDCSTAYHSIWLEWPEETQYPLQSRHLNICPIYFYFC